MSAKNIIKNILASADIEISGCRPWDIQVHNSEFYARVLAERSLGLGETYMDGWWDCPALDQFFYKILQTNINDSFNKNWKNLLFYFLPALLFNFQSKSKASIVGQKHYDKGNNLYQNMLDKRLVYTCAYWENARNLNEAQEAKLELVCRKIGLQPGMHVLDIGCGWGSFAKYAAEKYKVKVLGITISQEQAKLARELCEDLDIEIRLQDYRELTGKFDRIVSLGMFEHVGFKNYALYMSIVRKLLKDKGLFLLHTIGKNKSVTSTDPWFNKYIFPNSMLPSLKQIAEAAEDKFIIEDFHNFGADYDKTLMAWQENFVNNWDNLKSQYGQRFYRMWNYYLLSSAGSFRARKINLWQMVFSPKGVKGGYKPIKNLDLVIN